MIILSDCRYTLRLRLLEKWTLLNEKRIFFRSVINVLCNDSITHTLINFISFQLRCDEKETAIERESSDKQRLINVAEKMGRINSQFLRRFNVKSSLMSVIYFRTRRFLIAAQLGP